MTRTEQIKAIRAAYAELQQIDLPDGFRDVQGVLFGKNLEAERAYRKWGNRPPCGLGVKDAAKLFTVSHLLDGWAEPDKWTVDAILDIRTEVLYAQAYAKKFHKQLEPWADRWSPVFKEVDYAELMKIAA